MGLWLGDSCNKNTPQKHMKLLLLALTGLLVQIEYKKLGKWQEIVFSFPDRSQINVSHTFIHKLKLRNEKKLTTT